LGQASYIIEPFVSSVEIALTYILFEELLSSVVANIRFTATARRRQVKLHLQPLIPQLTSATLQIQYSDSLNIRL